MQHYSFRWTHATACLIAASGVSYQTAVIFEMLDGVSTTTKLGVPLATVSAALLAVLAVAAWSAGERAKALAAAMGLFVRVAQLFANRFQLTRYR